MKPVSLEIHNIGPIADAIIPLNKPLNLLYGDLRQGKTKALESIRLLFGGSYPQDIIKHGETEAHIEMKLDNGSLRREFYIAKDETTKARAIQFINDGSLEKKPVDVIKKFLNPFLLDQEFLSKMGETDRKKYFVDFFGIDTSELDNEIATIDNEAKDLRATIKAYGEIDLTPVNKPDIEKLKAEREVILKKNDKIKKEYAEKCKVITEHNTKVIEHDGKIVQGKTTKAGNEEKIKEIEKQILELEDKKKALAAKNILIDEWFANNPPLAKKDPLSEPEYESTTEIDEKISTAKADEVRYEAYLERLQKAKEKKADEEVLKKKTERKREIKAEKIAKLSGISDSIGIDGLSFDEDGNIIYCGTSMGMLSTSQVMELSSKLSALYPKGFGIELIDRGESLFQGKTGYKNISEFSLRAQKEELTILATVVSEKPAENIPDEVGVFIVEQGVITESIEDAIK